MEIDSLQILANRAIAHSSLEEMISYILVEEEREPTDDELNRANCDPLGVSDDVWPLFNGERASHLITIDLLTVPNLKGLFPSETRAISVFVSDPNNYPINCAGLPPENNGFQVVQLTNSDIQRGVISKNPPMEFFPSRVFSCHEVTLPEKVFSEEYMDEIEKLDSNPELLELRRRLGQLNVAGGYPLWCHGSESGYEARRLILQCGMDLTEVNTGDGGSLLVFTDTAFVEIG